MIDSNAVIDYLSGKLPKEGMLFMDKVINEIPNISVITKIEVLGYKTTEKATLLLTGFMDDSVILGLSDEIVEQTIEIRKEHKIKTPDAIIAATAVINSMTIITRNIKDLGNVDGIGDIDPFSL